MKSRLVLTNDGCDRIRRLTNEYREFFVKVQGRIGILPLLPDMMARCGKITKILNEGQEQFVFKLEPSNFKQSYVLDSDPYTGDTGIYTMVYFRITFLFDDESELMRFVITNPFDFVTGDYEFR